MNAENSCLNLASFSLAILDLQVLTSAGEEVFFKIKRNTKLSKLQAAYANKVGKDVGSIRCVRKGFRRRLNHNPGPIYFRRGVLIVVSPSLDRVRACCLGFCRFLYDGNRINDDDTPATLEMEDNGWFSSSPPSLTANMLTRSPSLVIVQTRST